MKHKKENLIIFTEGFTTATELCRDWKTYSIPQKGDYVDLSDYELFEPNKNIVSFKDKIWQVVGRTVTEKVLYVHLMKLSVHDLPYEK